VTTRPGSPSLARDLWIKILAEHAHLG